MTGAKTCCVNAYFLFMLIRQNFTVQRKTRCQTRVENLAKLKINVCRVSRVATKLILTSTNGI